MLVGVMRAYALLGLAVLILTTCALDVRAQTVRRWGLGMGIPAVVVSGARNELPMPISCYLPIETERLRLEPEIGLLREDFSSVEREETHFVLQLGSGIFAQRYVADNLLSYWGGRLGLMWLFQSIRDEPIYSDVIIRSESSGIGFLVGPATGMEYFPVRRFSMGGEIQLLYMHLFLENDRFSALYSRPLFFVRWYFR